MKIRDLMTKSVVTCRTDTNLAAAGALMWEHDCGFLPVVNENQQIVGVLTDRDICIALCTRNTPASEVTAGDVAISNISSCSPYDNARTALGTMREAKIHRLPVVNDGGVLEGIVSIDDVLMAAKTGDGKAKTEVPFDEVLQTLQAISAHHNERPLAVVAA